MVIAGQRVKRAPGRYTLTGCVPIIGTGGILNDLALSLPKPVYSPTPGSARSRGTVVVQVRVDEKGDVISASVVSGNPMLRASAVAAAREAKFSPFRLSEQPAIVGLLRYNFAAPSPKRKSKKTDRLKTPDKK
jgi:TonB family protein